MKISLLGKLLAHFLAPFKAGAKEWRGWRSLPANDRKLSDDKRFAAKLRGDRIVP